MGIWEHSIIIPSRTDWNRQFHSVHYIPARMDCFILVGIKWTISFWPEWFVRSLDANKKYATRPSAPLEFQHIENHRFWFPNLLSWFGTTDCGSQRFDLNWEPQVVVPNLSILIGNQRLWLPTFSSWLGTTYCGSQPFYLYWEPQIVVPNLLILIGNHRLWLPTFLSWFGTSDCGSQSSDLD